ncbi:GNAT family N-acetyltransferase [Streptomyces piniterrae]|uniref:GNAT family N-acetyltransferase n=1 Tax=Streptomyces piniterrae TaxID=2571125 RepID=UPI00145CF368
MNDMIIRDGTIIRRYRAADADAVSDLCSRASQQARSFVEHAHPSVEGQGAGERGAENWVAEGNGAVIAVLRLLPGRSEDEAEIGGLFVAPEAQGGDAGRQLVEHAASLRGALMLEIPEGDG